MKKVNKFEGLWEDEESIKMQKIINKAYKEEQIKRAKEEDKEDKKTLAIIILAGILFILVFAWLLVKCNKDYKQAVKGCVANGYTQAYCEDKLSR